MQLQLIKRHMLLNFSTSLLAIYLININKNRSFPEERLTIMANHWHESVAEGIRILM